MLKTCGVLARIVTRSFQYKQQQECALGLFLGCRSFTNSSSMATPGSAPQEFDLVTIGAGVLLSCRRSCDYHLMHNTVGLHVHSAHAAGVVQKRHLCFSLSYMRWIAGSGGVRASRFAAQYYNAKVACIELPFGFVSSEDVGGMCEIAV